MNFIYQDVLRSIRPLFTFSFTRFSNLYITLIIRKCILSLFQNAKLTIIVLTCEHEHSHRLNEESLIEFVFSISTSKFLSCSCNIFQYFVPSRPTALRIVHFVTGSNNPNITYLLLKLSCRI